MKRLFILLGVLAAGTYLLLSDSEEEKIRKVAKKQKKTFAEFAHKAKEL